MNFHFFATDSCTPFGSTTTLGTGSLPFVAIDRKADFNESPLLPQLPLSMSRT